MGRINLFTCIILFSGDRYIPPLDFLYKARTCGIWVETINSNLIF
ncbi:hypothetical protein GXM_00099 [Nostoc sphaeroides CCNUC1]|uniref:Uncharacterized protein n=1 Tax=Nostoc sphaeroides CCNUC1 TaxID=2653204 RepID=A0A5P8VQW2_9NOSO|nr:hypothetical protein GXM_00099 [Nostoc sphaeroides CCNUC1]